VGVSTYGFDVQATPQVRIFHRCRLSIPKPETTIPSQSESAKHRVSLILVLLLAGWVGGCAESDDGAKKFASEKERTIEVDDPAEKTQLVAVASGLVDTSSSEHDLEVEGRIDGRTLRVDLAWSGSWRNPHNWDAAWVFAKARRGRGPWQPLHLAPPSASAAVVASRTAIPPTVKVGEDGVGAWVYRSETGPTGRNDWTVAFDVDATGVEGRGALQVKVYGLEMVYVPEGPFYVGDGASDFRFQRKSDGSPFSVGKDGDVLSITALTDERPPTKILQDEGVYLDGDEGINPGGPEASARNDAFPTGYGAFYAMKYELTQGEYAHFLNLLTPTQAQRRDVSKSEQYKSYRGSIKTEEGRYQAAHPFWACNFVGEPDIRAFADWAGLRPMTELEFEKAARGDRKPVPGEYAWGTTTIQKATYIVDVQGAPAEHEDGTELVDQGNASYETIGFLGGEGGPGPLRVGIFAASSDGSRQDAGISFYGARMMSGNLKEAVVTLSRPDGRRFRGGHGDGQLDESGDADVEEWQSGAILGSRGGNFGFQAKFLRVSDRTAARADVDRLFSRGARLARTAPSHEDARGGR